LIWAIRDVSFDVEHGEVIGVIGRNGAGKSTLLKVLARITEPSTGRALLRGRVGSLLEVGTGFHPELTGRENIYLSGAILGMRRGEVDRKFDEIVSFAEVEKFLETPVKRYSSGMYVRLAFAVAAHLEPEILLVDEVLAVGDAAFQKKCLGKMGDVATEGRTILFVSHNMVAVKNLCQRAILLGGGRVIENGETDRVIARYLDESSRVLVEQVWPDEATAPGNEKVRIRRVSVRPEGGAPGDRITMDRPVIVEAEYWRLADDAQLHLCWHFLTEQQGVAFTSASNEEVGEAARRRSPAGLYRSVCRVPGDLLNDGVYHLKLLVLRDSSKITFRLEDALAFEVVDLGTRPGAWFGREPGAVRPRLEWQTEPLERSGQ
jgi:lipopolysaccharide transport system ATP-binding protein